MAKIKVAFSAAKEYDRQSFMCYNIFVTLF